MNRQTRVFYQFGPFKLDATERLLLREDKPLPLTPRGVELLLTLVENRGQLMEKDELLDKVWGDAFVEPANLTQTISVLRKLLEDDSQTPQYIQTVARRGYRFIAEVHEVMVEERQVTVEEQVRSTITIDHIDEIKKPALWRRMASALLSHKSAVVSTAAAFGLGGLGLSIWLILNSTPWAEKSKAVNLRVTTLIAERGRNNSESASGRFSPDGRFIAFALDEQNIRIMQVNGNQPLQVTRGQWRDFSPIWSKDGERLAFVSNRGNQIGVWTVPFLGGEVELLKVLGDTSLEISGGPPQLIAWTRDGRSIYYEWSGDLFRLDLQSKEIVKGVSFGDQVQTPCQFSLSQDERWLAFVGRRGGHFDIWKMELAGGGPAQVTNDAAEDLKPLWSPDGQNLVYNSVRDGRRQIYRVSAAGGAPEPLTTGDYDGFISDISPDGAKILSHNQRDESDLFAINIESGVERLLTGDLGVEFWPNVSPEGTAIVYQAILGERFAWDPRRGALFIRNLIDGTQSRRIAAEGFSAQWSPNSEQIAFLRWPVPDGKSHSLWLTPSDGGEEKRLVGEGVIYAGQTGFPTYNRLQVADYSWSPDSARIAYCAKNDGITNIWSVTVDGRRATRISSNADKGQRLHCPLWSPRGEQLAFVSESFPQPTPGKQVWSLWVYSQGKLEMVYRTESIFRLLGWNADDELIAALAANKDLNRALPTEVQIVTVSANGTRPRFIQSIPSVYLASVHLSPDRRNLSFVTTQGGRENIQIFPMSGGPMRQVTGNVDENPRYSSLAWSPDGKTIHFSKQSKWNLLTLIENLN
jgi:Tol biopolymer transport system component/DNA-binding winged helix-turn-helix (wHTH) protein